MELFKLFGSIAVDNADANKAIDETGEKAESFSSKLGNGIKTAAKWGTAIVAGASTAVAGLAKFAQSSAATADNIDKMSQKIGISREAYQELDFICSQSGTSVDSLQMGMKSLLTAMDGAVSGTESNIAQFERLGVTVTDANGNLRSQEEVMWDVMAALQSMDNQAEKARLANELFGRSGSELMPLLNGEAGSIEAMKEQAHELGLVLGDELVDNGVVLTDTLDQTKRAFSSIVTQLGGSLMPILTKVLTYIQKSLPSINALVGKLAPVLATLFDSLLPPLMELAEEVFPILFDLIEMLIPPVAEIVRSLLPLITSLLSSVIKPLVQLVKSVLPPLIKVVQAVIPPLIEIIQSILPVLTRLVEALTPITLTIVTDYPQWIKESTVTFRNDEDSVAQEGAKRNLDFNVDFAYNYASELHGNTLNNAGFVGTNFRLIIYGACTTPTIYISGHRYQVNRIVEANEYLTIDSVEKTITLTKRNGEIVNCFNFRDRDSYIFEKIPSGSNVVSWNGDFGFDIVLIEERSEPKWT